MTDTLFSLVAQYGIIVIAVSAFISCLSFPVPTAFMMLAGGAFAASGDLVFWQVLLAAYAAAILGDQTGFQIGRMVGPGLKRKRCEAIAATLSLTRTSPRSASLHRRWASLTVSPRAR